MTVKAAPPKPKVATQSPYTFDAVKSANGGVVQIRGSTAHAQVHKHSDRPDHINQAAEDLDDALKSIETLLSTASDKQSRRKLQAIHADVMAARDALEQ